MDLDYNREMMVGGLASILNALLLGSPVYGQTKFDVLNHSFTHRTDSPLAAYVCALFCGFIFFAGVPLINYLPRFLLAGLLIFSGAGFLVENLWDARKKYDRFAFISIWAVFLTFFFAGELLPQFGLLLAICVGIVLSSLSFAFKFAKKSKLQDPISGYDYSSTAVRSAAQEMKLGVLGCWYHIFPCSGYLFFGTSANLHRRFKQHVTDIGKLPRCERTKVAIFDMAEVDEADETALAIFSKITRLAAANNIELVWSGLAPLIAKSFRVHGILSYASGGAAHGGGQGGGGHGGGWHGGGVGRGHRHKVGLEGGHGSGRSVVASADPVPLYDDLDGAVKAVEDRLLDHVHCLAQKWLVDPAARRIYIHTMLHDSVTAQSGQSDGGIGPNQLLNWAEKVVVGPGRLIFQEGDDDDGLYLLYRGQVSTIRSLPSPPKRATVYSGACTYAAIQTLVRAAHCISLVRTLAALVPPCKL